MSVLVGQKSIHFATAQASFVYTQMGIYVLTEYQVFGRMFQLVPLAIIAEMLFVLRCKQFAIYAIMLGYSLYAFRCCLNLHLLKKQQTPARVWSLFLSDFQIDS